MDIKPVESVRDLGAWFDEHGSSRWKDLQQSIQKLI